ncbi:hypothetical protein N7326_07140 [Corynebacterium sp. ES2794-CONJ1]|nr:hypothetical protein [Corynebacterium sp. ES2715-CONJ3]MCU9519646.1 hypothetical protein [Corynebacterium sp. ES2794-CONJ1]
MSLPSLLLIARPQGKNMVRIPPRIKTLWLPATVLSAMALVIHLSSMWIFSWAHSLKQGYSALFAFLKAFDSTAMHRIDWDARHYMDIARYGYFAATHMGEADPQIYETRLAFFPGLPLLMRWGSEITGLGVVTIGLSITFIATVILSAGLITLATAMGATSRSARWVAIFFLGAPMSVTFHMVYTEAPFLAAIIWALIFLNRRDYLAGGLLIAVAGCFRLTSIDAVAALIIVVLIQARSSVRAWIAVGISALPLVGYISWASSYTHDIGGYFGLQKKGWNSAFDFGHATLTWVGKVIISDHNLGYILSVISIVGALIAVIYGFRRAPWPVWLFSTALVFNVVLSDGIMHSRPRLLLPALLLFIPLVIRAEQKLSPAVSLSLLSLWVLAGVAFSSYMLEVFPWAI